MLLAKHIKKPRQCELFSEFNLRESLQNHFSKYQSLGIEIFCIKDALKYEFMLANTHSPSCTAMNHKNFNFIEAHNIFHSSFISIMHAYNFLRCSSAPPVMTILHKTFFDFLKCFFSLNNRKIEKSYCSCWKVLLFCTCTVIEPKWVTSSVSWKHTFQWLLIFQWITQPFCAINESSAHFEQHHIMLWW